MKSDHFDGRHFFNPTGPQLQPFRAVPRMLLSRRTPWPKRVNQVVVQPPPPDPSGIVLTFVGHATFLIQTGEGNLLTDPVWAERAGPCGVVGPRRVRAPAIGLEDLPPIDVILLSHNHYDHCDLKTLGTLARRFEPIVIAPLGNARLLQSAGLRRVEDGVEQAVHLGLQRAQLAQRLPANDGHGGTSGQEGWITTATQYEISVRRCQVSQSVRLRSEMSAAPGSTRFHQTAICSCSAGSKWRRKRSRTH